MAHTTSRRVRRLWMAARGRSLYLQVALHSSFQNAQLVGDTIDAATRARARSRLPHALRVITGMLRVNGLIEGMGVAVTGDFVEIAFHLAPDIDLAYVLGALQTKPVEIDALREDFAAQSKAIGDTQGILLYGAVANRFEQLLASLYAVRNA